jgi:hypothetical protein
MKLYITVILIAALSVFFRAKRKQLNPRLRATFREIFLNLLMLLTIASINSSKNSTSHPVI